MSYLCCSLGGHISKINSLCHKSTNELSTKNVNVPSGAVLIQQQQKQQQQGSVAGAGEGLGLAHVSLFFCDAWRAKEAVCFLVADVVGVMAAGVGRGRGRGPGGCAGLALPLQLHVQLQGQGGHLHRRALPAPAR